MRIPRAGGLAQVLAYPRLDSVVWTSSERLPALNRVLAFNEDGVLAFVDAKGIPGRVDFRADNVVAASRTRVTGAESADGVAIFGFAKDGSITRMTPTGDWSYKPPRGARGVVPLPDGSLVVVAGRDSAATLYRLFPPETKILDSAAVKDAARAPWAIAGDRLYFEREQSLVGVRTRDLQTLNEIELDDGAHALVATPSGDRIYVLPDSATRIDIVDRYRERVVDKIDLPGVAEDLRIDPIGRYLLVKSAKKDSVWVVAIGTDRLVGGARSSWREDLPFVAPDGAIALADGADVAFVDGETLRPSKRIEKGASDFWYSFAWSGFRPRSASLDQPVQFDVADSADSARRADSAAAAAGAAFTPAPPADSQPAPAATSRGWIVSFAALLAEDKARQLAASIHVRGETARVSPNVRDGQTIYRVILGPYPTRDDAERVGRESRQTYWVYEATP